MTRVRRRDHRPRPAVKRGRPRRLTRDGESAQSSAVAAADGPAPWLTALQAVIASARGLVDELARDPLLDRLLRAFLMLPESDREPILRVLERDATWRRIVEETAPAT